MYNKILCRLFGEEKYFHSLFCMLNSLSFQFVFMISIWYFSLISRYTLIIEKKYLGNDKDF